MAKSKKKPGKIASVTNSPTPKTKGKPGNITKEKKLSINNNWEKPTGHKIKNPEVK
jgi:hypothetical protein